MSSNVEVEDRFNAAADFIQSNHQQFSKNELLQFYAFYKQSTVGGLDTKTQSRPSFFKVQERAKYDAWCALGSMSKDEAMESYIDLLNELKPSWDESASDDDEKGKAASFGASVSRPKVEDHIEDSSKSIEDFIKEGNIEKIKHLLRTIDPSELNSLDDNGLGLIHWASDRGNSDVLKIVINTEGINIDLQDSEGQTALFYASSCGHKSCVKLLLDQGANKNILDNEECSCIDVAYDDEIKKLLR